jgi:hypothetical protein
MSDTFTELCNLNTIFNNSNNYGFYPNIVYGSVNGLGNIYGGYSSQPPVNSVLYRFNANDPSGNNALLYSSKFDYIKAIAVDTSNDASGVYCFSSATPTKIYRIPLNFDYSSNITDIDLSGVAIPQGLFASIAYYMVKTSSDFYITYSNIVYRIPIAANYIVSQFSQFSSVPSIQIVGFNINRNTGKLYAVQSTDGTIYDIDASGISSPLVTPPTNTGLSNQIEIFDNKIYIQYKTSTAYNLGIYNIGVDTSFNTVAITGITDNRVGGITINTDNYKMYLRKINNSVIYTSTSTYCFNKGTKILCMSNQLKDKYVNIELLQIGDFVKTYKHGYRKVSRVISGILINNPKKWNMCMYKMTKTPTNGLIKDLIVTGGHSLLVDAISEEEQKKYDEMGISEFSKLTIDNKRLLLSCCSNQFTPMQDNDVYTYYHLLLENNDDEEERFGIWANGILTETPNEKTIK